MSQQPPLRDRSARVTLRGVDRQRVRAWIAAYENAWRTPGTDGLADLFTPEATYQQAPYSEPVEGLPAIARMWEVEREGPDEPFHMTSQLVAVDGDTAVARVEARYGNPVHQEYRDLWIMRFIPDGQCHAFEEWPFWPGGPYHADTG